MRLRKPYPPRKRLLVASTSLCLLGTALMAQQPKAAGTGQIDAATAAFEVATIRPANRDDGRTWSGIKVDASGRFQGSAVPLEMLVSVAYLASANNEQVTVGRAAPKWVSSDLFDLQAKVDETCMRGWSALSYEQRMDAIRPMLRQLLAERFRLQVQIETPVKPVYALVQAKGGAHVKEVVPAVLESDPDEAGARWMKEHPGQAFQGTILCSDHKCLAHAVKISDAVGQIASTAHADRMVIDETGLKGYYDLSIPFGGEEISMQEVGEELGMKFERRSIPIKTYVIESAEKPSTDGSEVRPTSIAH